MEAVKDELYVENVIYKACNEYLRQLVSGGVYFKDDRPANSKLEDAVIAVSTGTAGQIMEGRAKVDIFIADIDNGTGRLVKNRGRLEQLNGTDKVIVSLLNDADTDFVWSLSAMTAVIQSPSTKEYFYNINLAFNAKNF